MSPPDKLWNQLTPEIARTTRDKDVALTHQGCSLSDRFYLKRDNDMKRGLSDERKSLLNPLCLFEELVAQAIAWHRHFYSGMYAAGTA